MRRVPSYALLLLFSIGLVLFIAGIQGHNWIGDHWMDITVQGHDPWWMNSYWSVTAKEAYVYFAFYPLFFSGIAAGLAVALLAGISLGNLNRKGAVGISAPAIISVFLGMLGFNTYDWMVTYPTRAINGQQQTWNMWNYGLPFIQINAWNFYCFDVLVPIWIGGFLMAFSVTYWIIGNKKSGGWT